MDFEFNNSHREDLEIIFNPAGISSPFANMVYECVAAAGELGKLFFFVCKTAGVSIHYSRYDMLLDTVFNARADRKVLELRIALQHEIVGQWDGISDPALPPYYFSLCFTPHVKTEASFKKDRCYLTCDFHYEMIFLEELAKDFPVLDVFMAAVHRGDAVSLSGKAFHCTPEMVAALRFIETSPYGEAAQRHLVDFKAKEVLISAIEKMSQDAGERDFVFDSLTIEGLHFAKGLIEKSILEIEQNDPVELSLSLLSRKAGLNEFRFKKGFKLLFDCTPIGYLISLKMEKAKRMLLDTDEPVSSIAYTLGYQHPSNFAIEFKGRFGMSPTDFRKHYLR